MSAQPITSTDQATQEPVAWQWRRKGWQWSLERTFNSEVHATTPDSEVRALYAGPPTTILHALEREIATDHCRTVVEYFSTNLPSSHPMAVFDTSEIDTTHTDEELLEANRVELDRAVRYLDARELLVRPVPGQPQIVAFKEQAS